MPFRFNLDAIHSQARSSFVTDLPPSLNSRNDKIIWSDLRKGGSEAQYDVTYSIGASVYSKNGLEASTEKKIQVLPVSQAIGPRLQADCPGEYVSARSILRSRRISHGKPPPFKLEVAGQSPEAVCLSAQDVFCTSSTRIPFVVKALPDPSTRFDPKLLPTQCRVNARLIAKTLITSDGIEQHWIPIIEQGRHTENTALKVHKNEEQEFAVNMSPWRHVVPSKSTVPIFESYTNVTRATQVRVSNLPFRIFISTSKSQPTKHAFRHSSRRCCQGDMQSTSQYNIQARPVLS